ncbi:MAG TPA: LLM class flavin-dependent oxidoreductase, partial [Acidimicrobiales bacterium]|nr:LLM class flavin-dependent oxidoreductase [Acidimicrobiales bacterium]
MRLGIVTPVVNLNPRFDPPEWEERGGIEDVVEVARAAERLGYEWVSCPEHVAIPRATAATRGGRYWDPLTTLAFVAASTRSIGLLSHVVVLGYHHPLELVKRYGTLDLVSGGRVVLGVGVGSLEAEFELLGAPFADRGERADDALRAIRASFSRRVPSYSGTHYA